MLQNKQTSNFCIWLILCLLFRVGIANAQTGNHVASGTEAANFGIIDLQMSTSWTTDRLAVPGYFAAYGTASYINVDDLHHINGYAKHAVTATNQGFVFPVGSGTDLRTLVTTGTIANNTEYATAWIAGDPSINNDPTAPSSGIHAITAVGVGIAQVSNVGQWDWVQIAGSSVGVTITASIPDMSSFGIAADLRLVGWNGTQWVNLSGTTGASGTAENSTLSGVMIGGITALGIAKAEPIAVGIMDCAKTQIYPAPVEGTVSQNDLVLTVNVTTEGCFGSLTVSGSGMSLANGANQVCATSTGIQTFHIPLKYNGTALGTLTFTIGSAGSCTADLTSITSKKKVMVDVWTLDNCTLKISAPTLK